MIADSGDVASYGGKANGGRVGKCGGLHAIPSKRYELELA